VKPNISIFHLALRTERRKKPVAWGEGSRSEEGGPTESASNPLVGFG